MFAPRENQQLEEDRLYWHYEKEEVWRQCIRRKMGTPNSNLFQKFYISADCRQHLQYVFR
jgi:hypothetical protein